MTRFENKTVVITGAARGMGASHAQSFVAEGGSVVLVDRLHEHGERLATELGPRAVFVEADVTQPEDWGRILEIAETTFGGIDVLVNNAGILVDHQLQTATVDEFERTTGVNQLGVFLGMQSVVPPMSRQGGGAIVNIGSTAALVGAPRCFAYVASKWAVRGMTKAAAIDLADLNIRVNAVHPGDVETEMTAAQRASGELTTQGIALGRYGAPSEITAAVLFLASEQSSYITGADLAVDGGYTTA